MGFISKSALAITAFAAGMAPATQAEQRQIEEIVVTAEKREASIQDAPLAITALSADDIEAQQIEDVQQVQFLVPNMVFNSLGGTTNLYMRGIGTDITDSLAEAGTALHVNGVYQGRTGDQAAIFADIERIEVLRGPQGTLYGRNSTGGSVNIVTKSPGFESGFESSILFGNYDRIRASVTGQTTLIDQTAAVRANLVSDQHDSYTDNSYLRGDDADDRNLTAAALSMLLTPRDDLEIVLRADYLHRNDSTAAWDFYQEVPASGVPPSVLGGVYNNDDHGIASDYPTQFKTQNWGVNATVDWQIGDVTLRSITSYRETDWEGYWDLDTTPVGYLHSQPHDGSEEFSQELNLLGSAFEGKLDWILGAYYFAQDTLSQYLYVAPVFLPALEEGLDLPPGGLADPDLNPFYDTRLDGSGGSAIPFFDFSSNQDTVSKAIFAQGTYHLTPGARLTVGARYTDDAKEVTQSNVSNMFPSACRNLELNSEWSEVTGKVGLDVDVSENVMAYATVSRGFHAGGFNLGTCGNEYDPETLIAYEAGLKSQFLDQRLRLNIATFYYDYDEYQARLFIQNAARVENATTATIQGAEFEFVALLLDGMQVDGSLSWLDGEFGEFSADNPMTAADPTLIDLEGYETLRSPDFSANMGIQYALSLAGSDSLTARYELAYKGGYFTTVFNEDYARIDDTVIQNARLIWSLDDSWQVQGFVENLSDHTYPGTLLGVPTVGGMIALWAPPRTWGLQIRYRTGGI